MDDAFWHKPKLSRRDVAEQQLARLNTVPAPDHPEVAARKEREAAEALARHDERFARGFVQIEGAPYPVSRALARRLAEDFPGTAYSVGDEATNGPCGLDVVAALVSSRWASSHEGLRNINFPRLVILAGDLRGVKCDGTNTQATTAAVWRKNCV